MIRSAHVLSCSLALLLGATGSTLAQSPKSQWSEAVQKSLKLAGSNRPQIEQALKKVPSSHRAAMEFLVRYMPKRDLQSLAARFLLDEVALAMEVRDQTSFGKQVPTAIYFNDVLPYANVSETRESWRRKFRDRFLPLVKKAKTPGAAALILNKTIFGMVKVRYSTQRRRADQSPAESMAIGMASCTGLSILLTDACRSVGVPARLAGIPNWANKRGNHTWVEIWDGGSWHFVGAAEPSAAGLDHGWFSGDAALAKADDPRHSIYAVSYKPTGTRFPMVWARGNRSVHAVNVTTRYAKKTKQTAEPTHSRLMVCVRSKPGGERVSIRVELFDPETRERLGEGKSRGESADTNDYLTFKITPKQTLELRWGAGRARRTKVIKPLSGKQKIVTVYVKD